MRCLQLFTLLTFPFTLHCLLMRCCGGSNCTGCSESNTCGIRTHHMCIDGRWTALAGQALFDLLLLLQCLHKCLLQSIGMLRLQCLLHIRRDALLANHLGILVGYGRYNKIVYLPPSSTPIYSLCFSHFQTGVKSILHCAQRKGAATALAFLFTVR